MPFDNRGEEGAGFFEVRHFRLRVGELDRIPKTGKKTNATRRTSAPAKGGSLWFYGR
jgi:hypothetical protein